MFKVLSSAGGAFNKVAGLHFVDCDFHATSPRPWVLTGVDAASCTSVNTLPPFPVAPAELRQPAAGQPSLRLPPQEDWHYPTEEVVEMAALMEVGLHVATLHADSNESGTLIAHAANGSSAKASRPGDAMLGWTLRGFLTGRHAGGGDLAVLEFESARWGLVLFLGPQGQLGPSGVSGGRYFRKGVGATASVLRPKLAPQLGTSAYYAAAVADPTDLIRRAFENTSSFGETTFAAAAAYLPPTHDYALVGNARSHTKFSIAQDGKVWLANFSIFSPTDTRNGTGGEEPGVLLFDPREHLNRWPSQGWFSDYKTSMLGRFTRAVALAAWDTNEQVGFALTAVPNTRRGIQTEPYDEAELLLRLEQSNGTAVAPPRFFAVRGCVIVGSAVDRAAVNGTTGDRLCSTPTQCKPAVRCRSPADTATTELHDGGGLFHANVLDHGSEWADLFERTASTGSKAAAGEAAPMQVELRYGSEGAHASGRHGPRHHCSSNE